MKTFFSYLFFVLISCSSFSQSKFNNFLKPSDSLNKQRRNAVVISEAALGGLTLLGLNELWYNDYERSNFHTINDNSEWLKMDKLGHAFTAYQLGKFGSHALKWSGVKEKHQLLYGATLGVSFLTAVEVLDGFSKEWGFSWGDFIANTSGASLFIGQELLWKEQRISLKYSFHRTEFAPLRPDKLGEGFLEEFIKDYNGQTYWLSANLHSFFKESKLPKWLNVAFGYGADGMLFSTNETAQTSFSTQDRQRQFYLSLDVDLTKIKTNSRALKILFEVFNVFKLPFPTLELNDRGRVIAHSFYF